MVRNMMLLADVTFELNRNFPISKFIQDGDRNGAGAIGFLDKLFPVFEIYDPNRENEGHFLILGTVWDSLKATCVGVLPKL